jgi:GNAT superfamily N-acetyltransferase
VRIGRVEPQQAPPLRALLDVLNVSLFGIQSPHLHARLVDDAVRGRIDGRVASDGSELLGLVLAAPAWYWWWLPLRDWRIALDIVHVRLLRRSAAQAHPEETGSVPPNVSPDVPITDRTAPYDWRRPGRAWRIIFVGTSPAARGRGVAAALYRQIMAERSLVARIALDNTASLRLHASTGWTLHRDEGVVLAVHEHTHPVSDAPAPAAGRREAGR